MPIHRFTVDGYEAVKDTIAKSTGRILVFFSGSHVNGKSWCPDCVAAEPVVNSILSSPEGQDINAIFITCFVGLKDYWKNPECLFRTDADFKLTCIPTLIEYGNKHKRLLDNQLVNVDLIKEFLF